MEDNANNSSDSLKAGIAKKIIFKTFALATVICIFVISNNATAARNNEIKPVQVESSAYASSEFVHNKPFKLGTMEYTISKIEHQKDVSNPLLGKDSEYIIITMKVKNAGGKTEVFDAFDMILQVTDKGERKNIRNISDTTIYNISSGTETDIKLVYIVPDNSTDINIISEKNNKINLEVD